MKHDDPDLLLFEPSIVGHRLAWLKFITEDFLDSGYSIVLATDLRKAAKDAFQETLSHLLTDVALISVFDENGGWRGGSKISSIVECCKISRAKQIFLNELDEIASNVLRCAALGIYPPSPLKGRLSGVYFRPRFLTDPLWPPGNIIKASGFRRLVQKKWFQHIYLLDEYLTSSPEIKNNGYFHFIPDPWSGDYSCSSSDARISIDISQDKFVFLHYGIGDRRKGLHLVVAAMEKMASDSNFFLLCAGQLGNDHAVLEAIKHLEMRGMARLINRYVSDDEERLAFRASDVVILPYIHHYGSSGVLSRAAAAEKMVITSDEGLLAKRVREHDLGFLFPTNNIQELKRCMIEASLLGNERHAHYRTNAKTYAKTCSRKAFRNALISPWGVNEKQP